jgi:hypothetical protein
LVASAHPAIGYTQNDMEKSDGKYDFILEPINRILTGAARHHLTLSVNHLWCSVLPSPREMVNLVGYGIPQIYIKNLEMSKKSESRNAMETLTNAGIMNFKEMKI